MADKGNNASASVADEVAAAEANLKAAQVRFVAARQQFSENQSGTSCSCERAFQGGSAAPVNVAPTNPAPANSFPANAAPAQNAWEYHGQQASFQCIAPTKNHIAAGLLALFFGIFGIHKFYMGHPTEGFIMLGVTVIGSLVTFGATALIMQLIAVVEGLIYLIKTQNQFELDYVQGDRKWL
jgi:TM2 domain-containing membrane protein YozV